MKKKTYIVPTTETKKLCPQESLLIPVSDGDSVNTGYSKSDVSNADQEEFGW